MTLLQSHLHPTDTLPFNPHKDTVYAVSFLRTFKLWTIANLHIFTVFLLDIHILTYRLSCSFIVQ